VFWRHYAERDMVLPVRIATFRATRAEETVAMVLLLGFD
jgi:hypothetical protein